jgi:inner membrane protein
MSLSFHWFGLLGSVFPDIDLIWFYTLGRRQHVHHTYWTHIPIFWGMISVGVIICSKIWPRVEIFRKIQKYFIPNVFLHLVLDSVCGGILWLYPLSSTFFHVFTVPSRYGHWLPNFLLDWTFGLELVIVLIGLVYFVYHFKRQKNTSAIRIHNNRSNCHHH